MKNPEIAGKNKRVREVRIDTSSPSNSPFKKDSFYANVPTAPKEDCGTEELRKYVVSFMSHFEVKIGELGRQGEAGRSQLQRFSADMDNYVR